MHNEYRNTTVTVTSKRGWDAAGDPEGTASTTTLKCTYHENTGLGDHRFVLFPNAMSILEFAGDVDVEEGDKVTIGTEQHTVLRVARHRCFSEVVCTEVIL